MGEEAIERDVVALLYPIYYQLNPHVSPVRLYSDSDPVGRSCVGFDVCFVKKHGAAGDDFLFGGEG